MERGAGSGERGTEVWERVVSGNLHKNPKWRDDGRKMAERHWKLQKGTHRVQRGENMAGESLLSTPVNLILNKCQF